jgi:hypothetical protein
VMTRSPLGHRGITYQALDEPLQTLRVLTSMLTFMFNINWINFGMNE